MHAAKGREPQAEGHREGDEEIAGGSVHQAERAEADLVITGEVVIVCVTLLASEGQPAEVARLNPVLDDAPVGRKQETAAVVEAPQEHSGAHLGPAVALIYTNIGIFNHFFSVPKRFCAW